MLYHSSNCIVYIKTYLFLVSSIKIFNDRNEDGLKYMCLYHQKGVIEDSTLYIPICSFHSSLERVKSMIVYYC